MSEFITLPNLEEIAERIRFCRAEMAALRKLRRLARATREAEGADERAPRQRGSTAARPDAIGYPDEPGTQRTASAREYATGTRRAPAGGRP
jgi:hypothetical protein